MHQEGRPQAERQDYRGWHAPRGSLVEVRLHGKLHRRGLVDDAMPDASGLWLAPDGVHSRQFIDKASGYDLRIILIPKITDETTVGQ